MKTINYEEEHRKLWNWLADHPEACKAEYFKHWDYDSIPMNECFACEAARDCTLCPLSEERLVCGGESLFGEWRCEECPEKRRKLARQIANLPWKEKKR